MNRAHRVLQGKKEMEEHDRQLTHAIETKHTVQLGGAAGLERGWACCYAVFCGENNVSSYVGTEPQLRSELGNRLAALSAAAGLAPMGVVAYHEVRYIPKPPYCALISLSSLFLKCAHSEASLLRADQSFFFISQVRTF